MTVEKDFWEDLKEIIGIYKVHTALCYEGSLKVYKNNIDFSAKKKKFIDMDIYEGKRTLTRQDLNNIEKGDWVVVSYENKNCPEQVTGISGNQLEVSVMHS